LTNENLESSSLAELEHEGDVFDQDPGDASPFEEPEHVTNQARSSTADAGRPTRLTEILAGEPRCQELHAARDRAEAADIPMESDSWEMLL
jgi:hypothetical protein